MVQLFQGFLFPSFTVAFPSFAVLFARTVVQLWPSSAESRIWTSLASFRVPLTFQVTSTFLPPLTDAPFSPNDETRNGPAFGSTLMVTWSQPTPPPCGTRSRAVSRKCMAWGVMPGVPLYDAVGRNSE